MQACHRDELGFNIPAGKSSVVRPSFPLPRLESKFCEGKGDSFKCLPSPLSFLSLSSPHFSNPHYSLSSPVRLLPLHLFSPTLEQLHLVLLISRVSNPLISVSKTHLRLLHVALWSSAVHNQGTNRSALLLSLCMAA